MILVDININQRYAQIFETQKALRSEHRMFKAFSIIRKISFVSTLKKKEKNSLYNIGIAN